jgi:nickel-type superoxide dismutase maturation protease
MILKRHHHTHCAAIRNLGPHERIVVAGAIIVAASVAAALSTERVVVEGESMMPLLAPGDRLLVVRSRRPKPGQVVVLPDPRDSSHLLVKRVAAASRGWVEVRGDNEGASTDSRDFGAVPAQSVRGRVLYRYGPAERSGRVSGGPITNPAPGGSTS